MTSSTMIYLFLFVSAAVAVFAGSLQDNNINALKTNSNNLAEENSVETNGNTNGYKYVIYEPAPCQMVYSKYGCCWDKKSIPKGPNGEGCPDCRDHRHMRCNNWKRFCNKDKLVKEMCPETCGVCTPAASNLNRNGICKDDPIWRKLCHVYRELNFCKQGDIARHCRRSCGKC